MKKETVPSPEKDNESGIPIQLKLLLGTLVFAVTALIGRIIGLF